MYVCVAALRATGSTMSRKFTSLAHTISKNVAQPGKKPRFIDARYLHM